MMWSFSAHATFRKCPRQWFYGKILANARAKDPVRKEAHRLSKLVSIHAWRGKIVDAVISETVIPSVTWGRPCSLDNAKRRANELFTLQRSRLLARDGDGEFFEAEYGLPLTDEMFTTAKMQIDTALENLYRAEPLWTLLRQANNLFPQRPLSFKHGTVSVRVVPDLIAFHASRTPTVLDWKVNVRPMRDYWLQLVAGAIALTRCNPHRDWPLGATQCDPHDVQLLEVQLLTGDVRSHSVSETDVHEAEDFISISASDMALACDGGDAKSLRPEEFQAAYAPRTCQMCPFKKLCWEAEA